MRVSVGRVWEANWILRTAGSAAVLSQGEFTSGEGASGATFGRIALATIWCGLERKA